MDLRFTRRRVDVSMRPTISWGRSGKYLRGIALGAVKTSVVLDEVTLGPEGRVGQPDTRLALNRADAS